MVTCQSANQLKTPAKVSWAFKMVSQFGSLDYTIMEKTADLTVVQKTIIDTLHKEGKPQTFIAKEAGCSQSAVSKHVNRKLNGRIKCGRKRCKTNRENCSLMRIVKQIDSRIWVNFTRNGLRLGSSIKSHHTQTCQGIWLQLSSEASYLGEGEEELDCCPVVQSPIFRREQVLYFIWKPRS